ncbi:UTRA domain-containing protein [Actinoplanes sp. NPDC026670]|uniref:GntR family transcriptional regulator n=1 Tax=Actinoplanes sp. NPDC026670 TaxID=3154700 RepID=UPI0033FE894D
MSDPRDSTSGPYVTAQQGDAWAQDAARQGKRGTQRLLAVETRAPSDEVRDALELAAGETVVVRRRLILADGQPVELADSYYPARVAEGTELAEEKKIRGGAVRVLADAGLALEDIAETITARLPDEGEQEALAVSADQPLIVLTRVSRPAGGRPVEYAVNRMVADRTEPLHYRMRNSAQ